MKYLIWDFDGTLGYREPMWSGSLLEAIREEYPDHPITVSEIHPHLEYGYRWHNHEQAYTHVTTAEHWWQEMADLLSAALGKMGFDPEQSRRISGRFRSIYIRFDNWHIFDDTLPTLAALSSQGWRHIILSNHVPELPEIAAHLGITPYIDRIFNSADTGYEKPHPQAYQNVLDTLDQPTALWMIGDNPIADVAGANAMGIPAILVRTGKKEGVQYYCEGLEEIGKIVCSQSV
jgi:putative hydrolase of the HAD superfamily